jgi:hypothetical protein
VGRPLRVAQHFSGIDTRRAVGREGHPASASTGAEHDRGAASVRGSRGSSNYPRDGTLDLFAALNVATGEALARCKLQHTLPSPEKLFQKWTEPFGPFPVSTFRQIPARTRCPLVRGCSEVVLPCPAGG